MKVVMAAFFALFASSAFADRSFADRQMGSCVTPGLLTQSFDVREAPADALPPNLRPEPAVIHLLISRPDRDTGPDEASVSADMTWLSKHDVCAVPSLANIAALDPSFLQQHHPDADGTQPHT
ncbi:MAG: hypothetical protein AAF993_21030 [Pseudomonadota bacterium]